MKFKKFKKFLISENISFKENENIKNYTSIRIGGKVRFFLEIKTILNLIKVKKECEKLKIKTFILGNGTNLVFSDKKLNLVVIKLSLKGLKKQGTSVLVGSGESLFAVNLFAVKNDLSGLEWSFGIPGSVGGAVYMNAGSFGGEIKDVIEWVKVLDENNEIVIFKKDELDFGYRKSIFQNKNYIILQAKLNLNIGDGKKILEVCKNNLTKRKTSQPYDKFTAGSVFKKPKECYAWKLIEACGYRGYKIGGAKVSRKHCGFIENVKNAKFYDVLKIIYEIKKTVYKKFDIILEEEIQFVGDINGHFRRLSHTYDLQQKKMVAQKTR